MDLTAEEREQSGRAFSLRATETPRIVMANCGSAEDVLAAVNRAFADVFGLDRGHPMDLRLCCIRPVWVYGGREG